MRVSWQVGVFASSPNIPKQRNPACNAPRDTSPTAPRRSSQTGVLPTQLGRLVAMTSKLQCYSNKLCSDVPTEVQALSTNFVGGFAVTTGNSFGTVCGWQVSSNISSVIRQGRSPQRLAQSSSSHRNTIPQPTAQRTPRHATPRHATPQSYMVDSSFPTMDGSTSTLSIDVGSTNMGGTIPSEMGYMTEVTVFDCGSNGHTGEIPSEVGCSVRGKRARGGTRC